MWLLPQVRRVVAVALAVAYPVLAHAASVLDSPALTLASVAVLAAAVLGRPLLDGRRWAWFALPVAVLSIVWLARLDAVALVLFLPPVLLNAYLAWLFGHTLAARQHSVDRAPGAFAAATRRAFRAGRHRLHTHPDRPVDRTVPAPGGHESGVSRLRVTRRPAADRGHPRPDHGAPGDLVLVCKRLELPARRGLVPRSSSPIVDGASPGVPTEACRISFAARSLSRRHWRQRSGKNPLPRQARPRPSPNPNSSCPSTIRHLQVIFRDAPCCPPWCCSTWSSKRPRQFPAGISR